MNQSLKPTANLIHACTFCERAFSTASSLAQHWATSKGHPYCVACAMRFPTSQAHLTHHLATHVFPCNSCSSQFPTVKALGQHIIAKHFPQCRDCNQSFTSPENLERHRNVHHMLNGRPVPNMAAAPGVALGVAPGPSTGTGLRGPSTSARTIPLGSGPILSGPVVYHCPPCNSIFVSRETRAEHLEGCLMAGNTSHCGPCERDFKNSEALRQHLRDSPRHMHPWSPPSPPEQPSRPNQPDQPSTPSQGSPSSDSMPLSPTNQSPVRAQPSRTARRQRSSVPLLPPIPSATEGALVKYEGGLDAFLRKIIQRGGDQLGTVVHSEEPSDDEAYESASEM